MPVDFLQRGHFSNPIPQSLQQQRCSHPEKITTGILVRQTTHS